MITPWIIDAKDIDIASYNDAFSRGLLLRNEHVNQFLHPSNRSRFLVVAPKGYGKTLLLKGRRLAQRDSLRGSRRIQRSRGRAISLAASGENRRYKNNARTYRVFTDVLCPLYAESRE